jgi:hypothetical protein
LLGIRPIITDDQTTEVKFGKTNRASSLKIMPSLVVIDEVSMLGKVDFLALRQTLKTGRLEAPRGGRRRAQLAAREARSGSLRQVRAPRGSLRQIVRQAEGSAIISLAWAIRDGKEWYKHRGQRCRRVERLGAAFIEHLSRGGADRLERVGEGGGSPGVHRVHEPPVNDVQEHACDEALRARTLAFAPGELVLSETNLYRAKVLMCANQDELIVDSFMPEMRGRDVRSSVVIHHHSDPRKGKFTAHYLSPEDLKTKAHPYNIELEKRPRSGGEAPRRR